MTRERQDSCLRASVLGRLAAGTALTAQEASAVASHLAQCPRCCARLERARKEATFLRSLQAHLAGDDLEPFDTPSDGATRQQRPIEDARASGELEPLRGYLVLDEISRGGQAIVHRAVHALTGRIAALKVIRTGSSRDRARLEREAVLAARLRHPNIVTIYDCGILEDGALGVAMEFVEGVPLDEWGRAVERSGQPAHRIRQRKLEVVAAIGDAVAHAHRHGVIHRDLKPANILVDSHDVPRVLDFGVAHEAAPGRVSITRTGEFAGTLAYASPERLTEQGESVDIRSDVYSLGVVACELLTGRMPHEHDGSAASIVRAIQDQAPAVSRRDASGMPIDRDLAIILRHAMAKEPLRRYASADAVADDIRRYLAHQPISARRDSTVYLLRKIARRHRTVVALGGLIVALLAIAALMLSSSYRETVQARQAMSLAAAHYADELRASTLREAISLAGSGGVGNAEMMLWREVLNPTRAAASDAPHSDVDLRDALWALRNLQAAHACVGSVALSEQILDLAYDLSDGSLLAFDLAGRLQRLSVPGLEVTACIRLPVQMPSRSPIPVYGFSASGAFFAFTSPQSLAVVVETRSGREVGNLRTPLGQAIVEIVFEGDAHALVICNDGWIGRVDLASGVERWTIGPPPSWSPGGVISGSTIFYGAANGVLLQVDVESGRVMGRVLRSGWAPQRKFVFALTCRHELLYNFRGLVVRSADGSREEDILDSWHSMLGILPSPDGKLAAFSTLFGPVWICDLTGRQAPESVAGHMSDGTTAPSSFCFSPDSRFLACGSGSTTAIPPSSGAGEERGVIRLWRVARGDALHRRQAHATTVNAVTAGIRGDVHTIGTDGVLSSADPDGNVVSRVIPVTGRCIRAGVAPCGRWIATEERGPVSARLAVRSMDSLEPIVTPLECARTAGPICFSSDGRTMIAGAGWTDLAIVDCEERRTRLLKLSEEPIVVRALSISGDGTRFACGLYDGRLSVNAMDTAAPPEWIATGAPLRSLAWSPDGARLVSGHENGRLKLWDVATRRVIAEATAHDHWAMGVAFSPDGSLLASASYAGDLCIWSSDLRRRLARVRPSRIPIHVITFTRDGTALLAGDDEGGVFTWRFDADDCDIAANVEFWLDQMRWQGVPTPFGARLQEWARTVLPRVTAAREPSPQG